MSVPTPYAGDKHSMAICNAMTCSGIIARGWAWSVGDVGKVDDLGEGSRALHACRVRGGGDVKSGGRRRAKAVNSVAQ